MNKNVTAIVTDMNEHRTRKNGAKNIDYFSSWTDKQITTRHALLEFVVAGHADLTDDTEPMVRLVFPNGYRPDQNPGDNLDAVHAEGVRRGVFVISE